jgi:hypothetical protein
MSESGPEINSTKCVLAGASCAGTDDGGIVSIETCRAEEMLRRGRKFLLMSVNMSYETLIMPSVLYRTPLDMSQDGGQWNKLYRLLSTAESVRKFLS